MAKLKDKVFFVYNEANILRLGAQLLLGVQLQETLGIGFAEMPTSSQYLHASATTAILIGLALLIAPSAYHRIAEEGLPSEELHAFTSRVISFAIVPFVLTLGVEFDLIAAKLWSPAAGAAWGLGAALVGFVLLYGWIVPGWLNAATMRAYKEKLAMEDEESVAPGGGASLNEKIMYALMETQMILPGVQVLVAFQGGAAMSEGFDKLPLLSKTVFLASLALLSLTMLLLMMPAMYHRYVEQGEATERFHQFTSLVLIWSLIPFGLGMCSSLFVVFRKVSGSTLFSASASGAMAIGFYALWFGYAMVCRRRCRRHAGWFPRFHAR